MPRRFFRTFASSLQGRLSLFLVAVLSPGAVLAGWLILEGYRSERRTMERHLADTARALAALMEVELREREALLRGLATSTHLAAEDYPAFRVQALQTLAGRAEWVVATDGKSRQVVNTALPPDAALPSMALSNDFDAAMESGRAYISNLSLGPATGRQVLYLVIPIKQRGRVAQTLSLAMTPDVFTHSLLTHEIGKGWLISIVDRDMTIAGRNRAEDAFLGKKASAGMRRTLAERAEGVLETTTLEGVESITAFSRSAQSGWTVVVAAPRAELFARAKSLVALALGVALLVGALALVCAIWVGRSVVSGIRALVADTQALARGGPLTARTTGIAEIDFVSRTLAETSAVLAARESALAGARDEAVAASRAKDDFLAALSHELRTPLNPVLLLASDGARDGSLTPAIREVFGTIARNVAIEARLIDDLLDLTRIASGKLSLQIRPLEVDRLVRETVDTLRRQIQEKRLVLALDLQCPGALVTGDATRLQQVIWNLLINAIKFTPAAGRIGLSSWVNEDGGEVIVEVADTGMGMSAEEIARIFQRFAQGDHVTAKGQSEYGGLGLGLVIARTLVEMHHGRIEARSEGKGRGATFTVWLPLNERLHPAAVRPAAPAAWLSREAGGESTEGGRAALAKKRILLVEDHKPTLATLEMLLTRRGHEVVAAGSAAAALEHAAKAGFDLVISDIGLPDRSGYELMRELRERYGLKGIAMTGYGSDADLAQGKAAGFLLQLTKPVNVAAVEEALHRVFAAPGERGGMETREA